MPQAQMVKYTFRSVIHHCRPAMMAHMPRGFCHACAQASAPLTAGLACMTFVDGALADNTLLAHNTSANGGVGS